MAVPPLFRLTGVILYYIQKKKFQCVNFWVCYLKKVKFTDLQTWHIALDEKALNKRDHYH